jgi:hypothetical protein
MKNITISLPNELAHKAKVFAAEHNTSVSRFVGSLLSERLENELSYRSAMETWCAQPPSMINEPEAPYPSRDSVYER